MCEQTRGESARLFDDGPKISRVKMFILQVSSSPNIVLDLVFTLTSISAATIRVQNTIDNELLNAHSRPALREYFQMHTSENIVTRKFIERENKSNYGRCKFDNFGFY